MATTQPDPGPPPALDSRAATACRRLPLYRPGPKAWTLPLNPDSLQGAGHPTRSAANVDGTIGAGFASRPSCGIDAFAYVFAGAGKFCNASGPLAVPTESVGWADTAPPTRAENRSLVLFDRGDEVTVQAGEEGIRFLLVSGKPLQEPVAWYGPIVMNTQEQLRQAFDELEKGTFLK